MNCINDRKLTSSVTKAIVFHICFMACKNMLASSTIIAKYNTSLNIIAIIAIVLLYSNFLFLHGGIRRIPVKTFIIIVFVVLFWIISYCIDPKLFVETEWPYSYVRKAAVFFFAYGFPLLLSTSMLDDYSELGYLLYKYVDVLYYTALISFVLSRTGLGISSISSDIYSMSYGNNVLICYALLCMRYIDKNGAFDLIKMASLILFVIIDGSRGPLVSMFVMIMYMIIKISNSKKGIIFVFVATLALVLSFIFRDTLINIIISILGNFGISSRTLILLKAGELASYDSGRNWYHDTLIEAINQSPVLGIGAFGGEKTVSMSHSFYLDVFANFGYLFGALLLLIIGYSIIKLIIRHPNSVEARMVLIYSFILFPRGFFDDNVWAVERIWVIIGVLISASNHLMKNDSKHKHYYE